MNYHSHVTSHQVSRYTERALHVTRRHVMLQRRNKTVKWRLTKTKEFWLNINNGDMWRDSTKASQWIPAAWRFVWRCCATKCFYQMIPRVYLHFTRWWSRDKIMTWYRDVWQFVTCCVTPCPESERAERRNVPNSNPDCWHAVSRCIVSIIRSKWSMSRSLKITQTCLRFWCYRTLSGCGNRLLKTAPSPLLQSS